MPTALKCVHATQGGLTLRSHMKLIITDDAPVNDVKMALAKERHDRQQKIYELFGEGHCSADMESGHPIVTVAIEGEVFREARDVFPTVGLMARLQLAINAGQSNRNLGAGPGPTHAADAMAYGMTYGGRAGGNMTATEINRLYQDSRISSYRASDLYADVAKSVTATVKKFRKGLRP